MSADTGALATWIAALPPSIGELIVVAVDGPSGAGKTTLVRAVAAELNDRAADSVITVALDDVYPGWDGLDAGVGQCVTELLRPLWQGRAAGYHSWDWQRDRPGAWHQVEPAQARSVLLLDGVGSGARACASYLSEIVWVDAPAEIRKARALARDGEGYAPQWQRWADQEARHFAREQTLPRAGRVVAGAG